MELKFFVALSSVLHCLGTNSCTVWRPSISITFAESSVCACGICLCLVYGPSFAMLSVTFAVRQLHTMNRFFMSRWPFGHSDVPPPAVEEREYSDDSLLRCCCFAWTFVSCVGLAFLALRRYRSDAHTQEACTIPSPLREEVGGWNVSGFRVLWAQSASAFGRFNFCV